MKRKDAARTHRGRVQLLESGVSAALAKCKDLEASPLATPACPISTMEDKLVLPSNHYTFKHPDVINRCTKCGRNVSIVGQEKVATVVHVPLLNPAWVITCAACQSKE